MLYNGVFCFLRSKLQVFLDFFFFLWSDVEVILSFLPSLCLDHWPHPGLACSINT